MPDNTIKTLEGMLDVATFRQKLLASNIANADTPGYKAKDISFQKELLKAIEGTGSKEKSYEIYEPLSTMTNRDGNTVNLDIEMAKVAENTLTYTTAIQLMTMKVRMMKDVIKGGR
ncbi:MAG TPA: flagellar basal body rod protein FlgB [Nitrospiraceae bacterium]|nr:MAG: flagellar basal-body rod protein FlgB [Nitrospirae bacterium GWA2_46_11]OGW23131.1 MAG: flagellar basal-body rod protein FlgB [Nitrospirae bacterium GWB2_47_37]HAK87678.1 flagellar basal body rod protein FlgB [Nitrospiraceae bacterium]HCZ12398.1 flagellar basal body rod protein FlgB [Nitrospiraceae bacterium]